jgi:hypothetical protein
MNKAGFLSILFFALAEAQETKPTSYPAMAPVEQYRMANAQDEIALARSAAPASISSEAEVLVLGRHGYETAVKGKNGFVCLVERSWDAGFDDPGFWNPKIRGPDCLNPAAARSVLPQFRARAAWALAGSGKPEIIEKTRAAVSSGRFTAPEPGSLSYMLSKQGYLGDDASGPWLPHLMFFLPHGQTKAWGAGLEGSPILGADGSPFELTVVLIPVRRWSDGSPAPPPASQHQHSP